MNDKMRMIMILGLSLSCLGALGLYLSKAAPISGIEIGSVGIALILVALGLVATYKMWQSQKTGQPMKDEMTERLTHKAGYYTWLITIFIVLGGLKLREAYS